MQRLSPFLEIDSCFRRRLVQREVHFSLSISNCISRLYLITRSFLSTRELIRQETRHQYYVRSQELISVKLFNESPDQTNGTTTTRKYESQCLRILSIYGDTHNILTGYRLFYRLRKLLVESSLKMYMEYLIPSVKHTCN